MQLVCARGLQHVWRPIEPNEGYFFQFDVLYWSISAPKTTPIGSPGVTRTVYYGPHPLTGQLRSRSDDHAT